MRAANHLLVRKAIRLKCMCAHEACRELRRFVGDSRFALEALFRSFHYALGYFMPLGLGTSWAVRGLPRRLRKLRETPPTNLSLSDRVSFRHGQGCAHYLVEAVHLANDEVGCFLFREDVAKFRRIGCPSSDNARRLVP